MFAVKNLLEGTRAERVCFSKYPQRISPSVAQALEVEKGQQNKLNQKTQDVVKRALAEEANSVFKQAQYEKLP